MIDGDGATAPTEATVGETNTDGWIVRIVLGKALSRNSTVVLNYNQAAVQRSLTSDEYPVLIEAFSGPVLGGDAGDYYESASIPR